MWPCRRRCQLSRRWKLPESLPLTAARGAPLEWTKPLMPMEAAVKLVLARVLNCFDVLEIGSQTKLIDHAGREGVDVLQPRVVNGIGAGISEVGIGIGTTGSCGMRRYSEMRADWLSLILWSMRPMYWFTVSLPPVT